MFPIKNNRPYPLKANKDLLAGMRKEYKRKGGIILCLLLVHLGNSIFGMSIREYTKGEMY